MVWTALILGFAGSLHCLGMCSPLAMAIANISPTASLTRLIYNLGRILTYGTLGSIVASVGLVVPMARYQNVLSVMFGIFLVIVGFAGISSLRIPLVATVVTKISVKLKGLFARFLSKKNLAATFVLGALNGFLPCGLSFLALTYCISLPGPYEGFAFMSVFGLGTLPVMLGFTTVFKWLISKSHFGMQKLTTGLLIASGVLLIARVFIVHLPHAHSIRNAVVDIVVCR